MMKSSINKFDEVHILHLSRLFFLVSEIGG